MAIECNAAKVGGLLGCLCVVLFIAIFLFSFSFDVIEPTNVAILSDSVSKTIADDVVYGPGRYFIGLGKSFIKFPISWIIVDFSNDDDELGGPSLQVQLNEGQALTIDVSFYYRVDEQNIHKLYNVTGTNYSPLIVRKSQEIIKNVAADFITTEFFSLREAIVSAMQYELNRQLHAQYYVYVPSVSLRNVKLPAQLETALVDKVIADQLKKTAETQRNVTLIQAETQVIQALAQANVSTILQVANSNSFQTIQNAQSQAKKVLIDAQNLAFNALKTALFVNNSQLFNYLYTERISQAAAGSTIYVGFDGSLVVKQT